jgi:hypothetical protein
MPFPLGGDDSGSQRQLCCGANETVIVQDLPGLRENGEPLPLDGNEDEPPAAQLSNAV